MFVVFLYEHALQGRVNWVVNSGWLVNSDLMAGLMKMQIARARAWSVNSGERKGN